MSAVILIDDTFARADGAPGNGWVPSHAGVWAISGNTLVGTGDGNASPIDHNYDLLRPAGEDRLDTLVSATAPIAGAVVGNAYHSIPVVRYNRTTGDKYFGILLDGALGIGLSIAGSSSAIGGGSGMTSVTVGHSVRVDLTATGSNPTTLTATATDVNTGTQLGTLTRTDSTATLQAAGGAGVGMNGASGVTNTYTEVKISDLDGATLYTLTPASSSVHPAVAQTFSVLPNGSFIGTITPHVTGSAVVAPTSLAYTGQNTARTFTVTDAAVEVVTVSATNSASLTNPGNATLTVARKKRRGGAMALIRRAKMAASFQLPPRS